jgi:hypothetical protein
MDFPFNNRIIPMKKIILFILVASAFLVWVARPVAQTPDAKSFGHYEYASIRHMGGEKTTVHWPDGKISKIYEMTELRRPKDADERLWCLNVAMNLLARQGYEPVDMPTLNRDANDLWVRRPLRKP